MAYSAAEKQSAVALLDASKKLPNKYPACKIAEAARSYAMAVITNRPYPEVARRDYAFMGTFNVK